MVCLVSEGEVLGKANIKFNSRYSIWSFMLIYGHLYKTTKLYMYTNGLYAIFSIKTSFLLINKIVT